MAQTGDAETDVGGGGGGGAAAAATGGDVGTDADSMVVILGGVSTADVADGDDAVCCQNHADPLTNTLHRERKTLRRIFRTMFSNSPIKSAMWSLLLILVMFNVLMCVLTRDWFLGYDMRLAR